MSAQPRTPSPIPATIVGKDMARWIVSLSTLRNIPLPLNDEGALVLQPEITWGGSETLVGTRVALFLAKEGASPFERGVRGGEADGQGPPHRPSRQTRVDRQTISDEKNHVGKLWEP